MKLKLSGYLRFEDEFKWCRSIRLIPFQYGKKAYFQETTNISLFRLPSLLLIRETILNWWKQVTTLQGFASQCSSCPVQNSWVNEFNKLSSIRNFQYPLPFNPIIWFFATLQDCVVTILTKGIRTLSAFKMYLSLIIYKVKILFRWMHIAWNCVIISGPHPSWLLPVVFPLPQLLLAPSRRHQQTADPLSWIDRNLGSR